MKWHTEGEASLMLGCSDDRDGFSHWSSPNAHSLCRSANPKGRQTELLPFSQWVDGWLALPDSFLAISLALGF